MSIDWIIEGLKQPGKSKSGLADALGRSNSTVTALLRGERRLTVSEIPVVARYLGVQPPRFDGVEDPPHLGDGDVAYERGHPQGLLIKGSVAAGAWFEIDPHSDNGDLEFAPVVPSPQYPASAQYALRVRGDSINKIATEGDLLRCLDIGITGLEPRDGDLVIVEQVRDDGLLHEVTAKRVVRVNGYIQLEPESTNPRWKPIVYDPARDDGSIEVRIIAIVDTVIRPVLRGRG